MIRPVIAAVGALGMAACGLGACERAPRSAEYFAARPEEAARVVADCASGARRGDECVTARAAQVEAARTARIDAYWRQREGP